MLYPEQAPLRPRPLWLEEADLPWQLLERFLQKLEQGQRLTLRVTRKTLPQLFDFEQEDVDYLWELVRSLDKEFHILSIELDRSQARQQPYENALLRFDPEKEALVRHWLDRPALDPYALVWQHQLNRMGGQFEDRGRALAERVVRVPEQGAEATLRAFACIGRELGEPVTLRSLSARCFWGDSRFLDHSEDLVHALFPAGAENLVPRPVLMNISLPARFEQVLFVENQDTFLALRRLALPGHALVYTGGFHGSAARLRESGNSVFSYLPSGGKAVQEEFEAWWYREAGTGKEPAPGIPCWFFGDLDFAGMAILRALRETFPGTGAWQPGYRALLNRLGQGWGHPQPSGGREQQQDPDCTGCDFADDSLLPALRESGRFIDQEAVRTSELTA